jgi:hypothetical protein
MLEIFLLWRLGTNLAARAKAKGHRSAGYVLLFVALWFFGEFGGAVACAVTLELLDTAGAESDILLVYACGIAGAAVGASIGFLIVRALPDRTRHAWPRDETWLDEDDQDLLDHREKRKPPEGWDQDSSIQR